MKLELCLTPHTHTHKPQNKLNIRSGTIKVLEESIGRTVQFSSVTQSCLTLCDSVYCITPGFPVHHQLLELVQTHVHQISDDIQTSHPLSLPSPPAFNLSQHWVLFQWVGSSHQMAKVLELQASVLPMNIQCWFLSGLTGFISKRLRRILVNTTVWKHQWKDAWCSEGKLWQT